MMITIMMTSHLSELLYLFCTQASFALFRPQTGGKEQACSSQHLSTAGRRGCSSSCLSLNKSMWWRQQNLLLHAFALLFVCYSALFNCQSASWTWQLRHFSHLLFFVVCALTFVRRHKEWQCHYNACWSMHSFPNITFKLYGKCTLITYRVNTTIIPNACTFVCSYCGENGNTACLVYTH